LLQEPAVATLLAIQVARGAHALHQAHSSNSNNSSSGQGEQQQQQQQQAAESAPADTTNPGAKQLYQLLLDAAGMPGLGICSHDGSSSSDAIPSSAGESNSSSSRDVYNDMYDLVSGTIPTMQV
jgi:hypothetical protein